MKKPYIFSQASTKYQKLYRRLYSALTSGKFWRYSLKKRRMLFKRLQRFERKLQKLSTESNWSQVSIPAVSALLLFTSKGVKADALKEFDEKLDRSSMKMMPISNNTVHAYAAVGTIVGTISGGAGAPYTVSDTTADNSLFTVLNGDQLAVNAPIHKYNKSTLSISVIDAIGDTLTEVINVVGLPSLPSQNRRFVDSGELFNLRVSNDAALADMDNDADLDIVVLQDSSFTIYYNEGAGDFTSNQLEVPAGGRGILQDDDNQQLAIADMDGDGNLDVIIAGNFGTNTANYNGSYPIFFNDGLGTFTSGGPGTESAKWTSVKAADFDKDGDFDLIIKNISASTFAYENDGSGSFSQVPDVYVGMSTVQSFNDLADIDGDGNLDFIVTNSFDTWSYFGNGDSLGVGYTPFPSGTYLAYKNGEGSDLFDFDGDGDLDLGRAGGYFGVYSSADVLHEFDTGMFNDIGNPFDADIEVTVSKGADIDGDGDMDFISIQTYYTSSGPKSEVRIFDNTDGNGNFVPKARIPLQLSPPYSSQLLINDFDGDGSLDLFVSNSYATSSNQLILNFENNPISSVTIDNTQISAKTLKGSIVANISVTEPDGDSLRYKLEYDSIVGRDNQYFILSANGELILNQDISRTTKNEFNINVSVGDSFGDEFIQPFTLTVTDKPAPSSLDVFSQAPFLDPATPTKNTTLGGAQFADVDSDGDMDAVLFAQDSVEIWKNDGTGIFGNRVLAQLGNPILQIRDVDIAQTDGLGDADIVISSDYNVGSPQILYLDGGTYTSDTAVFNNNIYQTNWADIDSDGDFDILAAFNGGFGDYFGAYEKSEYGFNKDKYEIEFSNYQINKTRLADFDSDGDLEFVYSGGNFVQVNNLYTNKYGLNSFTVYTYNRAVSSPGLDFEVFDVDGDGDIDIATSEKIIFTTDTGFVATSPTAFADDFFAGTYVTNIEYGDMDGDGDIDIFLSTGDGTWKLLENDGSGAFTDPGITVGTPSVTQDIFIADIDNDTDLDIFLSQGPGLPDSVLFRESPPIVSVNTGGTISLNAGTIAIAQADLEVTDIDTPAGSLVFTLDTAPANGELQLSGTPLVATDIFTQADINAGLLTYVHNGSATLSDTFEFSVTDGLSVIAAQTVNVSILALPEESVNTGLTLGEGSIVAITNTALSYTDADNLASELTFNIVTAPVNGQLELVSNPGVSISTFTQEDIDLSQVLYSHDGSETTSDSFVFNVADGSHITADSTFAITVTPVNDSMVLGANTGATLNEGDTVLITNTFLQYTDVDNTPAELTFNVTTPPTSGQLELVSNPGVAITTFTQDDIDNSLVRYIHDGSETTADSFVFEITDGTATDVGQTFDFTITPVNDPLILSVNAGITLNEGATQGITAAALQATDADNAAADLIFTVTTAPVNGQLELTTNPGVAITSFSQANIDGNEVIYVHDGSNTTSDSFIFDVTDGVDVISATTFDVTVNSVNTIPNIQTNVGLNLNEGATGTITSANLETIDDDAIAADLVYNVTGGPSFGQLELTTAPGTPITSFTEQNILDNEVVYIHDDSENFVDSFTFTVTDGIDVTTETSFSIAIAPQNDNAPVVDPAGPFTVDENSAIGTNVGTPITYSDIDTQPATTYTYAIAEAVPFAIDDAGQITVSGTIDYQTNTSFNITVTVNDGVQNSAGLPVSILVEKDQLEVDSLMLVSVYNNNGGTEWTDATGWLSGNVSTWSSVTVTGSAVTALDLSANGLSGDFNISGDGLDSLVSINLSGNEIETVAGIVEKPVLATVDISDNNLDFTDLATVITGGYTLTYAPQANVLEEIETLEEVGTSYTVDRTVEGAEIYSWFRDGEAITETTATFSVDINGFDDEATYYAEVTNATYPDLTLQTNSIILKVSSLERDEASLRIVYEAIVTENSSISVPGAGDTVEDFPGVTTANNRVTELDLSGQGLEGVLPDEIADVAGLTSVDFSDNGLTGIPSLVGKLPNATSFNVSDNFLDFADLEPNATFTALVAESMNPIPAVDTIKVPKDSDVPLSFTIGGTQNTYRWEDADYTPGQQPSNFVNITGANSDSYTIQSVDFESMGYYRLNVDSDIAAFSDLTLVSEPTLVLATTTLEVLPVYEDINLEDAVLEPGDAEIILYQRQRQTGPFKDVDTVRLTDDNLIFEEVILGENYFMLVRPADTLLIKQVDGESDSIKLLPTYYRSTIDWVQADPFEVKEPRKDSVFMEQQPRPLPPDPEGGRLAMLVESDFAEDGEEGSRIDARRRVKKAGCSLRRRVTGGGRTDQDADGFELIAYKETDDNGNVSFGNLPAGDYKINIQYPGVPMDESSDIEFTIDENQEGTAFEASATITEEGISIELEQILGFVRKYFKDLAIFPNPADDYFTLSYKKLMSDEVSLKLVSLTGQTMKEQEVIGGYNHSLQVQTNDMREGIYLLYFYDRSKGSEKPILTFKVIVQHK